MVLVKTEIFPSKTAPSPANRIACLILFHATESLFYHSLPRYTFYTHFYTTFWMAKTVAMMRVMQLLKAPNSSIPTINGRLTMALLFAVPSIDAVAKELLNQALPSYIVEPLTLIARSYLVHKASQNLAAQNYWSFSHIPCLCAGWVLKYRLNL